MPSEVNSLVRLGRHRCQITNLGLCFSPLTRVPVGVSPPGAPTRTRALLARSPTRRAAARCAHRPHHPSPDPRRPLRVTQRLVGRALMRTYLPGTQAQGGHLGAVVEFQMASHDCCTPYTPGPANVQRWLRRAPLNSPTVCRKDACDWCRAEKRQLLIGRCRGP